MMRLALDMANSPPDGLVISHFAAFLHGVVLGWAQKSSWYAQPSITGFAPDILKMLFENLKRFKSNLD